MLLFQVKLANTNLEQSGGMSDGESDLEDVAELETLQSVLGRNEVDVDEVRQFESIPLNYNPLEWWNRHERDLPTLAILARVLVLSPSFFLLDSDLSFIPSELGPCRTTIFEWFANYYY